ncbi:MAG: LutB/LldF family L-lactate oxidation iron-sulfur protein [Methylacidiphilales bacterium]|nr:LutB/LldF family L-lactate oxidation iron-sulfur protein [Candidatus Methylacidiphilales bacterium]MDW8348675.1 LutB/LldF family L-lactate oxidation iron-sulfur protein [Verrucomicrobiae bacterium]
MKSIHRKFIKLSRRLIQDNNRRQRIRNALKGYEAKRGSTIERFQNWEAARQVAAQIKWEAINHLDEFLPQFVDNATKNGMKIHWADNSYQAQSIILDIAQKNQAKTVVKSKSMTTEEISLNSALKKKNYTVIETDLGELIVQLKNEPPYHLVFPSMHLSKEEIGEIFAMHFDVGLTHDPETLTQIAREQLRLKFLQADIGITGVNFAVAETGAICITENEGNARLVATCPRIHIAVMGIEKIIPRMQDLALFLPMLATSGSGQHLTAYNSLYFGPRKTHEQDGPEELHLIILDNQRTTLLARPHQRELLHCIRCGACLNICPVFQNAGGHAYAAPYQGPIGSVIMPYLRGIHSWKHLAKASTLCGACTEICPVKINLHHHLLDLREQAYRLKRNLLENSLFKLYTLYALNQSRFRPILRLFYYLQNLHKFIAGKPFDPFRRWCLRRELPRLRRHSFRSFWRRQRKNLPRLMLK